MDVQLVFLDLQSLECSLSMELKIVVLTICSNLMVVDIVEACGYLYVISPLLNMLSHLPDKKTTNTIHNSCIMLLC